MPKTKPTKPSTLDKAKAAVLKDVGKSLAKAKHAEDIYSALDGLCNVNNSTFAIINKLDMEDDQ